MALNIAGQNCSESCHYLKISMDNPKVSNRIIPSIRPHDTPKTLLLQSFVAACLILPSLTCRGVSAYRLLKKSLLTGSACLSSAHCFCHRWREDRICAPLKRATSGQVAVRAAQCGYSTLSLFKNFNG